MNILIVLTSHDQLGNTGLKTGFWLEELAAPYYVFKNANANIVLSSPAGSLPPIDPKSDEPEYQTDDTKRFKADKEAMNLLQNTIPLDSISTDNFDAVFYPGGHGPLWDLVNNPDSIALLESFLIAEKNIALVCHAPGVLKNVKNAFGEPLVKGKNVTGFTNSEEEAVGLTKVVPFLVEDELKRLGGIYSSGENWKPYIVHDGLLTTGQNPASSAETARVLIKKLTVK